MIDCFCPSQLLIVGRWSDNAAASMSSVGPMTGDCISVRSATDAAAMFTGVNWKKCPKNTVLEAAIQQGLKYTADTEEILQAAAINKIGVGYGYQQLSKNVLLGQRIAEDKLMNNLETDRCWCQSDGKTCVWHTPTCFPHFECGPVLYKIHFKSISITKYKLHLQIVF